jgi:hypothetical protein
MKWLVPIVLLMQVRLVLFIARIARIMCGITNFMRLLSLVYYW